jgi:hypothetical protein
MRDANLTEILSLPTRISPTPLERAMGRLMRAPDHEAGDDGAGADAGGDKADAAKPGVEGGSDAAKSDAADEGDGSLLGNAGADAGEGADNKADGEKGAADDNDKSAAGPPEAYDLKVTTKGEDGADVEVEIDKALLTEATPVLKELGLTNDQANKLAPLAINIQERMLAAQADNFTALKTEWAKEAKADPEIGGKNWPETEAFAARALDTFGAASVKDKDGNETNEFRILLNDTGLGNHPVMLKMFRLIGEKVGEDSTFARSEAAKSKKDRTEILYPDDVRKEGAK